MWRPPEDIEQFNRALVQLEQAYLSVIRGTAALQDLLADPLLDQVFHLIDENPYQAVCMTRIKSGHAITPRHGINVMLLARAWAVCKHKLGAKIKDFSQAALCHDLGHWRPDDLAYVFGPFSHDQARQLRDHPILEQEELAAFSEEAQQWIHEHHEQPDGKGYPEGMTNPHLLSQALRITDCFEGLTTPRRFRPPYTPHQAMRMMEKWAGFKFNQGLFENFKNFMGTYPVGSVVRLQSGQGAVILPGGYPEINMLVLTNEDGDLLDDPTPKTMPSHLINEEAGSPQLPIPKDWRYLRPDQLGLRRYYEA